MTGTVSLQTINASASPETQCNENFDSLSAVAVFSKRHEDTANLVWGFRGGLFGAGNIASGNVTMTANATNYIMAARGNGQVSVSTANTNWSNTSYGRMYKVTTSAANLVTAIEDHRMTDNGILVQPMGNGTVTSVGLVLPAIFTVSNSPVTITGNLTATLANQSAGMVFAGPATGNAAAPSFRALAGGDLPNANINAQTANYTLALSDANSAYVEMNHANDRVITVPSHANVAFANAAFIPVARYGAGNVSVAAQANVTLRYTSSANLRAQYSVGGLFQRAPDEWVLFGDFA